jgi:hypothetical protein
MYTAVSVSLRKTARESVEAKFLDRSIFRHVLSALFAYIFEYAALALGEKSSQKSAKSKILNRL